MKRYFLLAIVYLFASGVWGYWFYNNFQVAPTQQILTEVVSPLPLPKEVSSAPEIPSYRGDDIENIGNDLIIAQVPADYLARYKKELADLKKFLSIDPINGDKWLRVAELKKFFNNYYGARDVLEHLVLISPANPIPNFNLGGLYAGYLKNNAKAELNYKEAVRKEKKLPYIYLGLADFYSVFYKEKSNLAEAVLLEGLKNNPGDEALQQALDIYKASQVKP